MSFSYEIDYDWLDSAIGELGQTIMDQPEQRNLKPGYDVGFFASHERYKYFVYENARKALALESWNESLIGTGLIFEHVMDSLKKAAQLVFFTNKVLRERAYKDSESLRLVEQGFYDLYINNRDRQAFDEITGVLRYQYDKIAFFFFIKDKDQYLPIRPTEFETRFAWLHITTDCTHALSWGHYMEYIQIIREIGDRLTNRYAFPSTLLDAHSFVWSMWLIKDKLLVKEVEFSKKEEFTNLLPESEALTTEKVQSFLDAGLLDASEVETLIKYYLMPDHKATMRRFGKSENRKENEVQQQLDTIGRKMLAGIGIEESDKAWAAAFETRHLVGDDYELRLKPQVEKALLEKCPEQILDELEKQDEKFISLSSDEEIYQKAKQRENSPAAQQEKTITIRQYYRDKTISEWAKCRANGVCTLCGKSVDYFDSKGRLYLESHHIIPRAEGGKDSLDNVAALCPNCHRKMHIAAREEDKQYLLDLVKEYCEEENSQEAK